MRRCPLLVALVLSQACVSWGADLISGTITIVNGGPGALTWGASIVTSAGHGVSAGYFAGVGSSVTRSFNGFAGDPITILAYDSEANGLPTGSVLWSGGPMHEPSGSSYGSVTVYNNGTPGTGGPPADPWKYKFRTQNNTAVSQVYKIFVNGVEVGQSPVIPPGGIFDFEYSAAEKATLQAVRYSYDSEGQLTNPVYSKIIGETDAGWQQTSGEYTGGAAVGNDNITSVPNIDAELNHLPPVTDPSNLAKEETLRAGMEGFYNVLAQLAQQTTANGQVANGKLDAVVAAVNATKVSTETQGALTTAAVNAARVGIDALNTAMAAGNIKLDAANTLMNGMAVNLGLIQGTGNASFTVLQGIDAKSGQAVLSLAAIGSTVSQIELNQGIQITAGAAANSKLDTIALKSEETKGVLDSIRLANGSQNLAVVSAVNDVSANVNTSSANARSDALAARGQMTDLLGKEDALLLKVQQFREENSANIQAATNLVGYQLDQIGKKLYELPDEGAIRAGIHTSAATSDPGREALASDAAAAIATAASGSGSFGKPSGLFEISIPTGVGTHSVINLDPASQPGISEVASWTRIAMTWAVALGCLVVIFRYTSEAIAASGSMQQAHGTNGSVLGTGTTLVGYAVIIVPLLIALGLILAVYLGFRVSHPELWAALTQNPFNGALPRPIAGALYIINLVFPVAFAIGSFFYVVGYRLSLMGAMWVQSLAIRVLPA